MADETNATPPAANAPADETVKGGMVTLSTRRGYNYVSERDGVNIQDGQTVELSREKADKLLRQAPDYLVEVKEEKE